jgi:hypothetical protein
MKTLVTIIVALFFLTVNGNSQVKDVKSILETPETRTEIYNTILNNHELMMEFMTAMKSNEHASMMMNGNNQMQKNVGKMRMHQEDEKHLIDHDKMMGMMKENPEMMGNMCQKDSVMRERMVNMITEHPDVMQKCMKKMNEMGMMGSDGKMRMMKAKSPELVKHHEHK